MKLGTRVWATIAVAFLLVPALFADDTAKTADKSKKDDSSITTAESSSVKKGKPPAAAGASLPVPNPMHWGDSSGNTPKVELFLGYSFIRNMPVDYGNRIAYLHGGSTNIAFNLNNYLGIVFDFAGYHADKFGPYAPPFGGVVPASENVFTYMGGPRLSFRHHRFTPFIQALFGVVQAQNVVITGCVGIGCSPLPAETAFSLTGGVGLDVALTRHIALRLFQAEYMMTRFIDRSTLAGLTGTQNDIRLSSGLVFRFGGNSPAVHHASGPPVATCSVDRSMVFAGSGDLVAVRVQASDPDNNSLNYIWEQSGGTVDGSGPVVRWNSAGAAPGTYWVKVRVDNNHGGMANCSADIRVEARANRAPSMSCSVEHTPVFAGESLEIHASASDPDNDALTYSWQTSGGQISGSGSSVRLPTSGLAPGSYSITGQVNDGRGGTADCTVAVNVQPAPPPAEVAQLEARLALRSIYFQTDRPTIKAPGAGLMESQEAVLASLATDFKRYLTFKPDAHLILGAHADVRGSVAYNRLLTERRMNRAKGYLVDHGVPAANIEVNSFGKEDNLSAEQVKQQMQENPDLSPEDRQKMMDNWAVIVLANNRRVDIALNTTGQQSTRRYPFNAADALALISTRGVPHESATKKAPNK